MPSFPPPPLLLLVVVLTLLIVVIQEVEGVEPARILAALKAHERHPFWEKIEHDASARERFMQRNKEIAAKGKGWPNLYVVPVMEGDIPDENFSALNPTPNYPPALPITAKLGNSHLFSQIGYGVTPDDPSPKGR